MSRSAVVVALSLPLLAACGGGSDDEGGGGSSSSASSASEEPRTLDAAVEAGQEVSDRHSSGDFAGSWDLMSSEVKDGMSREDYVKLNEECASTGVPIDVEGVRMEGKDSAVVRLTVEDFQQSRTMVYEDGQWLQAPSPDFKAELDNKPVQKVIQDRKAEGSCSSE